jgi:PAS domain-containing protein
MNNRSLKKFASSLPSFASERRARRVPVGKSTGAIEDGDGTAREAHRAGEAVVRARNLAQVAIRDFDGTVRFWSEGMERPYDYARAEAIGQSFHRLLKTEFQRPLAELEAELLERGQWSGELPHRRRGGSVVIVESLWIVVRDGQDRPTSQGMSATVEETSAQATTVAAAAEQASVNVRTVASATEELSS